jgi:hypothetical protein
MFVKLEHSRSWPLSNKHVWVNMDHILRMEKDDDETRLYIDNSEAVTFYVRETPEVITFMLGYDRR